VITEVLTATVPAAVRVSVHSPHNSQGMSEWLNSRGLSKRIKVTAVWPSCAVDGPHSFIVANAARDHEATVERILRAGGPVLVEKPMALTSEGAQRLVDQARQLNVRLAAAHVLVFASYLELFARLVEKGGPLRSLLIRWIDPEVESRYGEGKHFDPSLPIFVDVLPHVWSLIRTLVPGRDPTCLWAEVSRGGAHLDLELALNDVACRIELTRNGPSRQRIIEARTEAQMRLDFSEEPGIITCGSETINADPDWESGIRPLKRMLNAFLNWAAGGVCDERLKAETGLEAARLIDETKPHYYRSLMPWLVDRLSTDSIDADLRYAVRELRQSRRTPDDAEIDAEIKSLRQSIARSQDLSKVTASETVMALRRMLTVHSSDSTNAGG